MCSSLPGTTASRKPHPRPISLHDNGFQVIMLRYYNGTQRCTRGTNAIREHRSQRAVPGLSGLGSLRIFRPDHDSASGQPAGPRRESRSGGTLEQRAHKRAAGLLNPLVVCADDHEQLNQVLTHRVALIPLGRANNVDQTHEGVLDVATKNIKISHQ